MHVVGGGGGGVEPNSSQGYLPLRKACAEGAEFIKFSLHTKKDKLEHDQNLSTKGKLAYVEPGLSVHGITIFPSFTFILGSNLQEFDEQDVKRVRDDDLWLGCFLKSRKQDVDNALSALVSYLLTFWHD